MPRLWPLSTRGRWLLIAALIVMVAIDQPPSAIREHPAAKADDEIRVLTINLNSRAWAYPGVRRLIDDERFHIVLLQESSGPAGQVLAASLASTYPAQVINYPHCSTRILARLRLMESITNADCAYTFARLALPEAAGGGEVVVGSVHLPRTSGKETDSQLETLRGLLTSWSAKESLIVGGDFNRAPWMTALQRFDAIPGLTRRTRLIPTWPARRALPGGLPFDLPLFPIDHVYATSDWVSASARRGPDVGSDHYPVLVSLKRAHAPAASPRTNTPPASSPAQ